MASRICRQAPVSAETLHGTEWITNLAFNEVSNTGLGHDWDRNGLHNFLDHRGVGHAGDTSFGANVGRDTLKGHDSGGTGFFSNAGLRS